MACASQWTQLAGRQIEFVAVGDGREGAPRYSSAFVQRMQQRQQGLEKRDLCRCQRLLGVEPGEQVAAPVAGRILPVRRRVRVGKQVQQFRPRVRQTLRFPNAVGNRSQE